MMLRFLHCRRRTRRGSAPSAFSLSTAAGYAGFLSTFRTRGTALPDAARAFRRNRLADAASLRAVSRKIDSGPRSRPLDTDTCPRPLTFYIGLVDPIAFVRGLQMRPASLIQFWRIGLDPAPDVTGVNLHAPFRQNLGDVFVGQRISQVPAHAQNNDLTRIVASFERVGRGDRHESLP